MGTVCLNKMGHPLSEGSRSETARVSGDVFTSLVP